MHVVDTEFLPLALSHFSYQMQTQLVSEGERNGYPKQYIVHNPLSAFVRDENGTDPFCLVS
jgi:hypothetical protein